MKKMLYLLMFVIMIASAFAAIEVTDVKLGGSGQERGNLVSADVSVKNTGANTLNSFNVSFVGVASKYTPQALSVPASIAPGATVTVQIKGFVPLDLDAVDANGKKISVDIGNVLFSGNDGGSVSSSVNFLMEAENNLEFGGDSEISYPDGTEDLDDGDDYNDVNRGDSVDLNIEIDNKFSNNGNCDDEDDYGDCTIEDIDVDFEPEDSDFDDDSDSVGDLNADDTDTLTLSFDVPDDIDEDEYDFDLFMTGTDENGALHGEFLTFRLDINVDSDELTITEAELDPSTLSCNERNAVLSVTIENTGTKDQSKASIFVESAKLGLSEELYNIDINDGDDVTKTFNLNLPKTLTPGSYPIIIRANYDSDEETDTSSVTLILDDCYDDSDNDDEVVDEDVDENTDEDDSNTDVNVIEIPPNTGVIVGEKKVGFFDTPQYVLLLAGLFLLALLVFFVLVVLLLRR